MYTVVGSRDRGDAKKASRREGEEGNGRARGEKKGNVPHIIIRTSRITLSLNCQVPLTSIRKIG